MFFEGTLQAGVEQSLREFKPVACFVRDEDEQSDLWEQSYLNHHEVVDLLSDKAVTLRILSGSQEAGYLAAYFPITVFPTLIIIENGQLIAQLQAGTGFLDFQRIVTKALFKPHKPGAGNESIESDSSKGEEEVGFRSRDPQSGTDSSNAPSSVDVSHQSVIVTGAPTSSDAAPPRSATPRSETTSATPATSSLQQVMADRRKRLEADKAAKDAAEKEKRKAVAQARHEAASAAPGSPVSKQASYAQEQRKRKQEAKQEKERILKAIENDKAERKEREAQRRALAKAEAAEVADADRASKLTDQKLPKTWGATQKCSLQIRLFDGTILRGKFEPQQTLNNDVRPWVTEQRTDGDTPYTFKQILTPLPNKTISISEEEESLQSMGLLPSATLVMVPVQNYMGAYPSEQGMVGKAFSVGYNAASASGSILKGAMGTMLGFGRTTPVTQGTGLSEARNDTSSGSDHRIASATARNSARFETLNRHQDGNEDHELYNGNQLNFEPRRNEDDE